MRNIPKYLSDIYKVSRFPEMGFSLEEYTHYSYVVYRLSPTGRPHLELDEWLDGFDWTVAEQRARTA
jgi:hypothetical protein